MFTSSLSEELIKSRPQQHLKSISFFQLGKGYQSIKSRKFQTNRISQFSSWLEKDEQPLFNQTFFLKQSKVLRKKSTDSIFKNNINQRIRSSHSVTLQTKKIDLGAQVYKYFHKFHVNTGNKIHFSSNVKKMRMQLRLPDEKRQIIQQEVKQDKKPQYIFDSPQKEGKVESKQLYNFIQFPITSNQVRKRKLTKIQPVPIHSLAMRLYK